jgi:hypothetical protein
VGEDVNGPGKSSPTVAVVGDLGGGVVVGHVETALHDRVGQSLGGVVDADQLLLGDGAIEEGDQAGVAGDHLAVGDEAAGQPLVDSPRGVKPFLKSMSEVER